MKLDDSRGESNRMEHLGGSNCRMKLKFDRLLTIRPKGFRGRGHWGGASSGPYALKKLNNYT